MENYIKFLEETKVYSFQNIIKDVTFYKWNGNFRISFVLACKSNHLQPLKNLGLKIDFSNKRVGMAINQNSLSGTGNNIAVNCICDLQVFKTISVYFRDDFRANLLNDCQLVWAKFPFTPAKIKVKNEIILKSKRVNKLICEIRNNVHKRKYPNLVYNMPIVQKAINRDVHKQ